MKIMVISSHTSSLFWFRIDMMKEFIRNGYDVIAVGSESEDEWKKQFDCYGVTYRQIHVQRNGLNPVYDLKTLNEIKEIINEYKPDKIFAYQAKTIVYGSIAAKQCKVPEYYSLVAGLGSVFRGSGLKNNLVRAMLKMQYKTAFKISKKVIFQNKDDKNEFVRLKIVSEDKTVIINGSGVDTEKYKPMPLPEKPAFLFIGRLIKDKGVIEYLNACREIKKYDSSIRCVLVGPFDSNPSAMTDTELQEYVDDGTVEYFGEQKDVIPFIGQCSVFVLPSYFEGTPKTVLEAMSCARAIITTDAPGCRETVKDGENGCLVPVGDVQGIADKMKLLIENPDLMAQLGQNGRKIAVEKYDIKKVNLSIMKIMGIETQKEKNEYETV